MAFIKHRIEFFVVVFIIFAFLASRIHVVDSFPVERAEISDDDLLESEELVLVKELCLNMMIVADWKLLRKELKEYCVVLLIGNQDNNETSRSILSKRTKSASNPNKKLTLGK